MTKPRQVSGLTYIERARGRYYNGLQSLLPLGDDLYEWWTADRFDLLTLSANNVSAWKGTKLNWSLSQPTIGYRPSYDPIGFNGAPAIVPDGTDDYLELANPALPGGADPVEIWAVAGQGSLVADTADKTLASYRGNSGLTQRTLQRVVSGGANRAKGAVSDGAAIFSPTNGADFSNRHVLRFQIGATQSILSVDGAPGTPVSVVPATSLARLRVFALGAASPSLFYLGPLRDLAFTTPLNSVAAAAVTKFLMSRRML